MNINGAVPTPVDSHGEFTLESLGLATQDHLNKDGVLGYQTEQSPQAVIHQPPEGSEGTTSLNENEIEQLPDWKTKLVTVNEGVKKIVDLSSIQKDIEATGLMDGTKAKALNATLESIGENPMPMHTFTSFSSRTGADAARKRLAKTIGTTNESLLTQFREVHPEAINGLIKDSEAAKEYCIYDMRDHIADAVNKIDAIRPTLKAGPIMLPFAGDEFVDMTSVNLMEIDMDKLKQGVPVSMDFRVAFANMKEIWSKNATLRKICEELSHMNRHSDTGEYPVNQAELYVKTLSHFFKENAAAGIAEAAGDLIAQASDDIKEDFHALPVDALPCANTTDIISTGAKELLNRQQQLAFAKADIEVLCKFAQAVTTVLLGLVSLR